MNIKKDEAEEELTYIQKISNVFGIPVEYVQKFRDTGCMNETAVRNALIRSENSQMKKSGMTVKKRMGKLREKYNIEMRQLQNIIAAMKHIHYCKYCGRQITINSYLKHDSVCPQCIINRIKL